MSFDELLKFDLAEFHEAVNRLYDIPFEDMTIEHFKEAQVLGPCWGDELLMTSMFSDDTRKDSFQLFVRKCGWECWNDGLFL